MSMSHPVTMFEKFANLGSMGFATPRSWVIPEAGLKAIFEAEGGDSRATLPYDIDGLVLSLNDLSRVDALGVADDRPVGQTAIKFAPESIIVTIEKIEWSYEGGYSIAPVGIYAPQFFCGKMAKKVALKSLDWLERNKIGVGSKVMVIMAGDILPAIDDSIQGWCLDNTEHSVPVPEVCPFCGSHIVRVGAMLQCPNELCSAKEAFRIERFLTILGIKGLSGGTLKEYTALGIVQEDFFLEDNFAKIEAVITPQRHVSKTTWAKVKAQLVGDVAPGTTGRFEDLFPKGYKLTTCTVFLNNDLQSA